MMSEGYEHDPRMGVQRSDREGSLPMNPLILPATDSPGAAGRRGHDGAVASLVLGSVVTLMAPLTLLVSIHLAAHGPSALHMDRMDVVMATVGLVICLGLVLLLGLASLFFALSSMSAARRHAQPITLPLAGLFLNWVGLLLFLAVTIDMICVLEWFNRARF